MGGLPSKALLETIILSSRKTDKVGWKAMQEALDGAADVQ
jgi:hypothetical protein